MASLRPWAGPVNLVREPAERQIAHNVLRGSAPGRAATSNLVDVQNAQKEYSKFEVFVALLNMAMLPVIAGLMPAPAQSQAAMANGSSVARATGATPALPSGGPPPSSVGSFPLNEVKRGMKGTAWTVFEGSVPEPMEVEILGVLRGARGPGRDLILARLLGEKPEYTGVVAGMSGSPVYLDGRLLGALSYRIGQFSKEPIAGITPIEQMLEVRDIPLLEDGGIPNLTASARPDMRHPDYGAGSGFATGAGGTELSAMETPLVMSGFQPEAIKLWKERVAGTGLEVVSAGGGSGSSALETNDEPSAPIVPGSAVSLELVRGDLEIAATCTVTYVDPKQLLACGHPVLQAGPVSLPMTSTEVVATLASPLNAFKIVNTGRTIGAFTEDRDAAIRGVLGGKARMIPVSIGVSGIGTSVERKMEILDLASLTPQAMLVSIYQTLLETNQSSATTSYHVTGEITVRGTAPVPVESWGAPGETMAPQLAAALGVFDGFNRLYANASRQEPIESVRLHVEAIPQDLRVELEGVRVVSSNTVHAGDTVVIEATLRPWRQAARNVRLPFQVPARLGAGNIRLLIGNAAALDRTLEAARASTKPASVAAASARLRGLHAADRLYVSLLVPESQASLEGNTLDSLPPSMANSMEPEQSGQDVSLHGESVAVVAEAAAGGVLTGQQLLILRVESGGGLK